MSRAFGWSAIRSRSASLLLFGYKHLLSPPLHALAGAPGACRFQPTCSEYAAIAVSEYGIFRGGAMALLRVLRCHPLHPGGFDPVPAKRRTPEPAIRFGPLH